MLHAAIIALAFVSFRPKPSLQASQPGVSVVFDNGGQQANTAPPAQRRGPLTPAKTPPPPAPPPPPPQQLQPQQPEVNLNLPTAPFAELSLPPPQQQTTQTRQAQPTHMQRTRPAPHHSQYQVMNDMSLGNGSSPAIPNAKHGLNLNLSQSDLNAMNTPQIQVEGNIGQDWMDGFNKWVNDHIYYPQAAVENNQQGSSVIQFTVHRDGTVTGVHLLSSAGSTFLDQAWLGIFLHNNVPPFPAGTKSDTIKITATLQYQLIPQ